MAEYQGLNLITRVFFGTGAITCSALDPSSPDYNFLQKIYRHQDRSHNSARLHTQVISKTGRRGFLARKFFFIIWRKR